MANILQVRQGDWQAIETGGKLVLADFWAEWCAPCRMMAPIFEKLADQYGNAMTFAKINVDEQPALAEKFGIRSIPTLVLLQDGNVLENLVGTRPYGELARVLEGHLPAIERT